MRRSMLMPMLLMAMGASAVAQTLIVPGDAAPPGLERKACAEHNTQAQGDTHETQGRGPSENSLSDKLAQSGGVICPPEGLDPDIRAPAPGGGEEMPVIPPPTGQPPQPPE